MEGYKFKLQKLLDIREDREEESKRFFKDAQLEKKKAEDNLNSMKDSYNKYRKSQSVGSLAEQKLRHIYLNALSNSIVETTKELKKKETLLEERREDLKQKQVERKTVEILKEKQLLAFTKEQALAEQKANDEFALYGFIRTHERR